MYEQMDGQIEKKAGRQPGRQTDIEKGIHMQT
jgi:hypothetical protein